MKRYLTTADLDPYSQRILTLTREYLVARSRGSNMTYAGELRTVTSELDSLWHRWTAEIQWQGFWEKFKLLGLSAADIYDIKAFVESSFPGRTNRVDLQAESNSVTVVVDMGAYQLTRVVHVFVPPPPKQKRPPNNHPASLQKISDPQTQNTTEAI